MQDLIAQIFSYINGVIRFRWPGMIAAWVVCLGGWVGVLSLPDVYEASARVYVDTQSALRPLLSGIAVNVDVTQRISFMTRSLLSRPNLEKVARMTDMDLQVKTPEAMEKLLDNLASNININTARGQFLYTIGFSDSDPQLAKRVVQSLLNIFVESTLGAGRKDTDTAQQFLEQQIREYEQRLIAGEERLKDFKRKHVGMMPGQGGGYYSRMEGLSGQLESSRLRMRELEMRREELERQIEGEEPSFGLSQATGPSQRRSRVDADKVADLSPIDQRIQAMLLRKDEMLLQYTEKHPDVMAIERTIQELEKQKLEDLGVDTEAMDQDGAPEPAADNFGMIFGGGGNGNDAVETNPVYQQMRIALGEADAELASVRVRVQDYEARIQELQSMVDTLPQIEAEMTRLNRNYEVNKKQYDALVARLESARISQEADQSSDNVKFKIIDPPRVPLEPSGPPRLAFLIAVLVGGVLSGVAVSFALALTRPVFDSSRAIETVTGFPVLGTVTMVPAPGQKFRKRVGLLLFLVATSALLTVFAGALALEILDVDMASRLGELKERFL